MLDAPDPLDEALAGRVAAALLALGALAHTFRLGAAPLYLWDEGMYCGVTADMRAHGQWLLPTQDGIFWGTYGKPPLVNWLQGAATALLGWGVFALRLPTALGMLALLALGWLTARRLTTATGVGLVALALPLLSATLLRTGRHILLEDLVAPAFAAALLAAARSVEAPSRRAQLAWSAGAGLAVGGAILTKQAFGLFALAALAVAELAARRPGARSRLAVTTLVAAAASAWWFLAAYDLVGQPFVDSFFGYHVEARFLQPLEGHARGLNAYAKSLDEYLRVVPWPMALVGWVFLRRRLATSGGRFLWTAWSALLALEFVVAGVLIRTFLPWYQIVVMPPLVVGAAALVVEAGETVAGGGALPAALLVGLLAAAAGSARLDAVLAAVVAIAVVLLARRTGLAARVGKARLIWGAAALVAITAVIAVNPLERGDGRTRVAARARGQGRAQVIGGEWLRVWSCYLEAPTLTSFSGDCAQLGLDTAVHDVAILDEAAAVCPEAGFGPDWQVRTRDRTPQGAVLLLGRRGAL